MDVDLIGDNNSLEEKKLAEKLSSTTDTIILTSLWQILFKGIDELRISPEPITSLEMLLIRACHMSIMPSPDTLIKSVLHDGSHNNAYLQFGKEVILENTRKGEIIQQSEK